MHLKIQLIRKITRNLGKKENLRSSQTNSL